jgi:gamma-glutamyltranspeptidase/glutathione hydrolase
MRQVWILLLAALVSSCQTNRTNQSTERVLGETGDSAMVVAAHPLATQAGLEVLRKGGNAYDAAVAVHFALAVVFPEAGNIGGGGFAVVRTADGSLSSLDFREKAPQRASKNMYLDENGEVISKKSRLGHYAAGVPGSVAGMWALHQRYGQMDWSELLIPAIRIAYYGYPIPAYTAKNLNEDQQEFKEANRYEPWTIKPGGWQAGDSIKQRELAATLTFIQKNGRDGFYKGIVADQIFKEMLLGNGLINKEDLASYEPVWRDPLIGQYKGHRVVSMPPPSSGGVALIQLLQGAEMFDLSESAHNSVRNIHVKTELERRVYADRATHLGDPDFYPVPVEMLLDPAYNRERYATISLDQKTPSEKIKEGKVEIIESVETTHYSIVDLEGNAVSITTTLNSFFGCKVMVKGAGFFLNNEMNDFSAKPGVPNMFGLIGAEANAIAPEKRMLSSMTPTLLEKDGKLFMVIGSPGGATIITSVFQCIVNVIDHEMTMQEAVNAKRTHHQWLPDRILLEESTLPENSVKKLQKMGHEIEYRKEWGRVDAILMHPDGSLEGAADPRSGDNTAAGF